MDAVPTTDLALEAVAYDATRTQLGSEAARADVGILLALLRCSIDIAHDPAVPAPYRAGVLRALQEWAILPMTVAEAARPGGGA